MNFDIPRNTNKGLIEMLFATFIWGSIPLFSIWCSLPSPVFVFFRILFGLPFILLFYLKKFGFRYLFYIKPALPLISSGLVLALNWVFFFWAISLTNIATAVVLYYFGPIFTIILAVIFLNEPLNKILILAVFLAFMGVLLTISPSLFFNGSWFGVFVAFLSGLFYGLLGFVSKIATFHYNSMKITVYQMVISLFFTLPFVFVFDFSINLKIILLLVVTGVVHTALALFLWYDSLNYIRVSTSAVFSYLDPFFAILLGYIFLDQIPSVFQLIGGVLISVSGVVISVNEKTV